jgi:hypothetical protein
MPGMPVSDPRDLHSRLTTIIKRAPSIQESGPLSDEVMRWAGDVSALIERTGNIGLQAETQVAVNGLLRSERIYNYERLQLILHKAVAIVALDLPLIKRTKRVVGSATGSVAQTASAAGLASGMGTSQAAGVGLGVAGTTRPGELRVMQTAVLETRPSTRLPAGDANLAKAFHSTLMARVAVLEVAIEELRAPGAVGIGHNRPPADEEVTFDGFTPEDVKEISLLISLLKEQPPVPSVLPFQLIEQNRVVSEIGTKIGALADSFAEETVKSAGKEAGKRLMQVPFWGGILYALHGVVSAFQQWLAVLPQ